MTAKSSLPELCINTIRTLSIDAVQKANSGHPGLPLGAAPMAYALWQNHLRHDPRDPAWPDRDRFVLSAGHGSMLLYSLVHLAGYDVSMEDLQAFRQWESRTPGHPEYHMTPGVEATTGPLGQGVSNAVGMAMAERFLANRFNRPGHDLVDHFTYALVSDGDLMEGIASEAISLAGHLGLGKLIFLYDANDITLDGPTSLCFTGEDVCARIAACGWHVQRVEDGDRDIAAIDGAISAAKAETGRPSLIFVHTTIGFGSPNKAGKSAAHGSPLGPDEVALTKKALGLNPDESFAVPKEAREHMAEPGKRGRELRDAWHGRFEAYAKEHPDLAAQWQTCQSGELPAGWERDLPSWEPGSAIATRSAAGKALGALSGRIPWLFGGDADLSCSTKTLVEGGDFNGVTGAGRNIRFGVREHAMAGICNGMSYHGGIRPDAATFFVFSDYMRPSVRLAALNHLPVVYVWTHDSIGVGEDGPTHQPVEHLMSLRAMPNLHVIRPADGNEAAQAWVQAIKRTDGPTALVLSRQNLPVQSVAPESLPDHVARGAYVLSDPADGASPEVIVMATGSEVQVAMAAQELLAGDGIAARVVSMPCWEAFAAQSAEYRESILPAAVTARVSVEAGVTLGWQAWVGLSGAAIGVDRFGASAPGGTLMKEYGITPEAVADKARELLGKRA